MIDLRHNMFCAWTSKETQHLEFAAVEVQEPVQTHLGAQIHPNALNKAGSIHIDLSGQLSRV